MPEEQTIPNSVTLTIDGREVAVPPGATILAAARSAGIEIPHLCDGSRWNLPPTGSCRLCLVEVEGARSLVASCIHPAAAGMVVRTDTERVRRMQRMVIELLLSDQPRGALSYQGGDGGELLKYARELGVKESPYACEPVKSAPVQDGPAIVYDRSKCILCGRCVQVCQDVQASGAIDYFGRGYETRISLPPGQTRQQSTCSECGNCIDVCPTGAMARAGRGEEQSGELRRTATICPYCGCGCTIVLNIRDGHIVHVTGEPELGVNQGMLCVKGRFGVDFVGHPDRLTEPLVRRDGRLSPATWDEALTCVASRLSAIRAEHGPDAVAALASAKCTNEENYVLQKFARAVIGTNNVDHCARLCHASTVTGLAQAFGSGAMTNSLEDFDVTDCIFVIGSNPTECHPIIGSAIKRAARRGAAVLVADPRSIELTEVAAVHLRQRGGTDVALINTMMRVILDEGLADEASIAERTEGIERLREAVAPYTPQVGERITGVPAGDIVRAARLYAQAPAAMIVYAMGITQHTTGTDNVLSLANLAMLTGNVGVPGGGVNPLRGQNNVQGACDMGALPNMYSGYQRVDDEAARAKFERAWGATLPAKPGLTSVEILNAAAEGGIKALVLMGENPMISHPDLAHVEDALRKLDFLVVQDIFLSETARLADVVLPAASFAEKDGTFTNTERRVQRVRKAVEPPGQARTDWAVLCDLAGRMGFPAMAYADASGIQDEIASLTPIYGGITYARLEAGSLQWPCPDAGHPGTPYLHKDCFARGLGRFHAVEFLPPQELPDEEYPLLLSTGRILEHFHTGTMTRRAAVLDDLVPLGALEVHPSDAAQLGFADGETVRVASRRGRIEIAARLTDRVAPGTVFLAFHYHEAPANRLTLSALDPLAKIPEFKVCAVQVGRIS